MNPFTLKYNPEYFCDRENEILRLNDNISNGLNTLVHSPRRLGKSALIKHLFHQMEKKKTFETVFVDLFATQNLDDFTKTLGEAILQKYHSRNIITGIKNLFKGLHASITFSADGTPKLNLGLGEGQVQSGISQLFDYLEQRKRPVVVAFDEFQEIAEYPEKAEALLRALIQNLQNVTFIYSGSSNHILQNMVYGAKQPFFQSSESLVVDKIQHDKYSDFIKQCFKKFSKEISSPAIKHFLEFTETHTYYTHLICNQAFYKSNDFLDKYEAIEISNNYIETRKVDYFNIYHLLPLNQRNILRAIAKEGIVQKPSAVDFLIKHKLPSSSSSLQALHALVEKEMIYRSVDGYKCYDVFFRRFLERYF